MSDNQFDVIKAKGWEIAEFHAVTNGVAYTEDERVAIDVGISCGVHAAIEAFVTSDGAGETRGGR